MAESAESLFRRGMISPKQAGRLGIVKGTRAQSSKMAAFDDKEGLRDQGGIRDRGAADAGRDAINKNQREGSPIAAKPSKGGRVNRSGQPRVGHIDAEQGPAFPAGAKVKGANRRGGNKAAQGRVQPSGPEYGGPNSRADG